MRFERTHAAQELALVRPTRAVPLSVSSSSTPLANTRSRIAFKIGCANGAAFAM
jgi:hypothetical protein